MWTDIFIDVPRSCGGFGGVPERTQTTQPAVPTLAVTSTAVALYDRP